MKLNALKRIGFFVGCSLLTVSTAAAQGLFEQALSGEIESDQSEDPAPSLPLPTLEMGGYARGGLFAGKVADEEAAEVKSAYGELSLTANSRMGSTADAHGELRLRAGSDFTDLTQLAELREAFVNLYLSSVDVRIGQQVIVWGRADGINPTDVLTPRNMGTRSPNFDDRRLANMAIRSNVYFGPMRLESVWLPIYIESRFPPFELPGALSRGDSVTPSLDLSNGTLAQRLHLETGVVEASVSYVRGFAPFPGLALQRFALELPQPAAGGTPPMPPGGTPPGAPTPEMMLENLPDTPPEMVVGFRAYRQHVVGADFATAVGTEFGLRGEAALRWPDLESADHEWVPLPDVQYVVGVDRELAADFVVVVQYVGRYVFDWDGLDSKLSSLMTTGEEVTPQDLLSDLSDDEKSEFIQSVMAGETPDLLYDEVRAKTRILNGQTARVSHSLAGAVRWTTLHSNLSFDVGGSYNFTTKEWLARPLMTYRIADRLELSGGAEIYDGPEETMFGLFSELMSAAFVELKGYF